MPMYLISFAAFVFESVRAWKSVKQFTRVEQQLDQQTTVSSILTECPIPLALYQTKLSVVNDYTKVEKFNQGARIEYLPLSFMSCTQTSGFHCFLGINTSMKTVVLIQVHPRIGHFLTYFIVKIPILFCIFVQKALYFTDLKHF